ncbi:MAG: magnesium/cobalt transporter CorA [Deltaproteobacteria bacterium]|nr:magnesium/cobalt transporter CorA [Deltaproteobacteria bacterium]
MLTIWYRDGKGNVQSGIGLHGVPAALADAGGLLWVDLAAPSEDEWRKALVETFNFHPLAVEDAVQDVHHPKVDGYDGYVYLVVHGVRLEHKNRVVRTEELDIFLGKNFVVTHHREPISTIDDVIALCAKDERRLKLAPDMFVAELLGSLIDHYLPVIDAIDAELDEVEGTAIKRPDPKVLDKILSLKRSISNIRRVVGPQREVINKIIRGDFPIVSEKSRPYFRDVYDHIVRIIDINDAERDLSSGLLDLYLSVVSYRLNDVMRVLTVVTVIIMPLTLISSIYGMNFKNMPELGWHYGYFGILGLMAALAVGLVVFFRKRRWL